jgi:uncharacterized protein
VGFNLIRLVYKEESANKSRQIPKSKSFCDWAPLDCYLWTMSSADHNETNILVTIISMKMPFGKYKGRILSDLPVEYLEWFARKGFPPGKMGMLLSTVYEIKLNGLEHLLTPLKKK